MKCSLLTLALASSASASIFARDASTIEADLTSINTNLQDLISKLTAFTGDITTATPIIDSDETLDKSIQQGTTDAKGTTGPLSDSDTTAILDKVNVLIPNILSAANAFVAKQPLFSSAGLGEVASSYLGGLQSDTNAFASALVPLAASGSQAEATSAVACIEGALSSAVAGSSASSCGGAAATTSGTGSSGASSSPAPTSTGATHTSSSASSTHTSSTASPAATTNAAMSYRGAGILVVVPVAVAFAL